MNDLQRKLAFMALCMGFFMVILDVTIVNVALPSIAQSIHTSISGLQWVVDAYTLTFASLLLLVGSLSDYFGAKIIFKTGLMTFVLTSLGCGLSRNLNWLIFFRLLQGASGALLLPSSLAMIVNIYQEEKERARAIGVWAALGGLACASGPFLGGVLTSLLAWPMIFFVNVLIGSISFYLITRFHTMDSRNRKVKFDFWGQILGIMFIFPLAYGLIEASIYGWSNSWIISCFIISLIALIAFLIIEKKTMYPMIPLNLFHNRTTAMAIVVALILCFCFYGQLFMMPFYFENIRHYSVLLTGLAILPLPSLALLGSYLGGKLTAKIGAGIIIFTGLLIAALGFFVLLFLKEATPAYVWLILPFFAIGFGVSLATPAMTFAAIHSVSSERSGIAAAVSNTSSQIGSLIGVAVYGTLAVLSPNFMSAMHVTLLISGIMYLVTACLSIILMELLKVNSKLCTEF